MNKRQLLFSAMCDHAGVKLVDWGGIPSGRVGGLVEAANGRRQRFSISNHRPSDGRSDLNARADMKRFANENAETINPPPPPPPAPPKVAFKRTVLRVAQEAKKPPPPAVDAPAPPPAAPPAPVAPPPAAAPALIQFPTSTTAETPNMTNRAAIEPRNNRLTTDQQIDLNDYVRSTDATQFKYLHEMAAAATKKLGFDVTIANLKHPLARNKVTHFERKAHATTEGAYELAYANATAMRALADNLGFKLPSEAVAVYDRHGIEPLVIRKAA